MSKKSRRRGRETEKEVRDFFLNQLKLHGHYDCENEVVLPGMSEPGVDVKLSKFTEEKLFNGYSMAVEVKRKKRVALLRWMEQAREYEGIPIVLFREDRGQLHVMLDANDFMMLLHP